ncbi:sporulation protein [Anaerosporomusa subterranea]|jgi:putative sporulation protein YyaC|uniref:Sporulation protein n=1 Tax=Anaerosporomusa subterranea TaxID=1794912 RepID=A0A154BPE9_ANASB|nr:spore protease YyaC [Anaerosporomusa subterranea]KYZ75730.1 sporulation protein [Anaerosporomusa subterranea]MDF2501469.1 putative sporulation protein YyaC [Anaerosporomusa subterranea]
MTPLFDICSPTTKEHRYPIQSPGSTFDLASGIRLLVREVKPVGREVVVVCIGSDRSTGDSLGPLTGSKLQSLHRYPHVFGTLDEPVHATNLAETLDRLHRQFESPFLIAVDACLGRLDSVGCVTIGKGALKPGAAVKKELPPVGDVYVTGIVNVGGFMEHLVLQSTRLQLVMKMAETIASAIAFGLHTGSREQV